MGQRPHNKTSSKTRSRSGSYNPHAGAVAVLASSAQPIVGPFESRRDGDDVVSAPTRQVTAKSRAKSKSQRVKNTKTHASRRTVSHSRTKPPLRRKSKTHDLKATVAPLLATVGVLLLIPAVWSTLLLVGITVPGADREGSQGMAAIMLLSWPIAICLLGASVAFFVQVIRYKRQVTKRR